MKDNTRIYNINLGGELHDFIDFFDAINQPYMLSYIFSHFSEEVAKKPWYNEQV